MALFVDGCAAGIEDLRAYESSILDVASLEKIDLSAKLRLAHRELSFDISTYLYRSGYTAGSDLDRVVVTAALTHAETIRALELAYRDAYNSQLNDRYLGRVNHYSTKSRESLLGLFEAGVGLTMSPVGKAAPPTVEVIAGGTLLAEAYQTAVAWLGPTFLSGEWSDTVVTSVPEGALVKVTPPNPPMNAVAYHVYVGRPGEQMKRQTLLPLSTTATWTLPLSGLRSELPEVARQGPDLLIRHRRLIRRG